MEVSADKTELLTSSASGIQREIKVKGQQFGIVRSFKYVLADVSDGCSKLEVLSMIEQATSTLTKLKSIWGDNAVCLGSKVKHALSCDFRIYASNIRSVRGM